MRRQVRFAMAVLLLAGFAVALLLFHRTDPPLAKTAANSQLIGNCGSCDMDLTLSGSEVPDFERRARAGDLRAAAALGNNYVERGKFRQARQWYALLAEKGDCVAIDRLSTRDEGEPPVPQAELRHWQTQYRLRRCSPRDVSTAVIENSPVIE